jgi:hypothetical protein
LMAHILHGQLQKQLIPISTEKLYHALGLL